jgi:imidazole glycerol-phosphate synthase subunit HisH
MVPRERAARAAQAGASDRHLGRAVIGIVDIQMGNLRSVANAVDQLGQGYRIVKEAAELDDLSHVIVPGVGNFATAMRCMADRSLKSAIRSFAQSNRPVLGICLGMQLLAGHGDEGGFTAGLELIPGHVRRFEPGKVPAIPHVGWNGTRLKRAHPVFDKVRTGVDFYFVHSFHFSVEAEQHLLATVEYGDHEYAAVVGRDNILGFQFHPEKSQANGLRLLENYCNWDGKC